MLDNNKIVSALQEIKDPATGRDLIATKRLKNFKIEDNNVFLTLNIEDFSPEQKSSLNFECIGAIKKIYPEAEVHIHIEGSSKDGGNSILPQVTNIVAVGSGKGGVGKSTVSVNTAIALSNAGYKVGLIDADLYGPSIPTMMGLQGQRPKVEVIHGRHKLIPLEAHGVSLMSIGFIVEPEQAVVLRGPRLAGIIKQFIQDCIWPDLDYLLIDLPPGTGDIQLTLVQTLPLTGAMIVTTPQEVAVVDAVKAVNMFLLDNVNVPILGVVENMSWFTPEELPENKYFLFGQGGGQKVADFAESPLLAQIPLVQGIRECSDIGSPISAQGDDITSLYFKKLANEVVKHVTYRNENLSPTEVVKVSK